MSNERVNISLDGYDDQVFPSTLDDFNFVYDQLSDVFDEKMIENVGLSVDGFVFSNTPKTDDLYGWYTALHFVTSKGMMAVLFPWSTDTQMKDNSSLDRSIAFYTSGNVSMQEGEDLAFNILMAFTP